METKKLKKDEKITLKDYVEGLSKVKGLSEKQLFIRRIMNECNVSENCVRNWVYKKPREEENIQIIEKIMGISRKYLWQ